jgi:SsrA-binding protein
MSKKESSAAVIALNKKATHDYFIEQRYEAGLALEGWEVKSLREGRIQLVDSYVLLKNSEAFLIGTQIPPLLAASTHVNPDPTRTRKLLLNRHEINKLIGAVTRDGYTVIPTKLYWARGRVKLEIGLAKGKKQHDKRATEKERDWQRDKARLARLKN